MGQRKTLASALSPQGCGCWVEAALVAAWPQPHYASPTSPSPFPQGVALCLGWPAFFGDELGDEGETQAKGSRAPRRKRPASRGAEGGWQTGDSQTWLVPWWRCGGAGANPRGLRRAPALGWALLPGKSPGAHPQLCPNALRPPRAYFGLPAAAKASVAEWLTFLVAEECFFK